MINFKSIFTTKKIIFVIFLILLGILGFIFYYLFNHSLNFKNISHFKEKQEVILEQIQKEKEKYQNDIYGGKTPLETYKLFLEALKKEDINLAVKYFPVDLQEKYFQLFTQIKKSGQWEKMMVDLLREENQQGEYINNDWYNIKIKNSKNEVVTTVVIKLIKDFNNQPVNNIWKIVEF